MDGIVSTVNAFILDPKYASMLALVKAARNGAVYGAKVRFPHALVMVFLFRSGSFREKMHLIFKATRQHARNLAMFAFTYKAIMYTLKHLPGASLKSLNQEASYDTFIAGFLAGFTVFGRGMQSSVNQQIVIYVFARVVLGLAKLAVTQESLVPQHLERTLSKNAWPVFAATSWGLVMWLFRWHPDTLQPSLRSSMKYIYSNADTWSSFKTFLIHNS